MSHRFTGRSALVTGGGSGLGAHIATRLALNGAEVVVVGRSEARLEQVADTIRSNGGSARAAVCDVADSAAVDALSRQLADPFSILINNAGIGGPVADLVDIDSAEWDEVFDVNVKGTFLMCRAFIPRMIERGVGDVINIASVTGKRPLRGRTPYAASKMAVIGLTSTLAWEVGPHGVNVNSLSPGPIDSERMTRNFTRESERTGRSYAEAEREFVSRSALQRLLTEDEVAQAVVAMLEMPGLAGADIDLSAGMVAR